MLLGISVIPMASVKAVVGHVGWLTIGDLERPGVMAGKKAVECWGNCLYCRERWGFS